MNIFDFLCGLPGRHQDAGLDERVAARESEVAASVQPYGEELNRRGKSVRAVLRPEQC